MTFDLDDTPDPGQLTARRGPGGRGGLGPDGVAPAEDASGTT